MRFAIIRQYTASQPCLLPPLRLRQRLPAAAMAATAATAAHLPVVTVTLCLSVRADANGDSGFGIVDSTRTQVPTRATEEVISWCGTGSDIRLQATA